MSAIKGAHSSGTVRELHPVPSSSDGATAARTDAGAKIRKGGRRGKEISIFPHSEGTVTRVSATAPMHKGPMEWNPVAATDFSVSRIDFHVSRPGNPASRTVNPVSSNTRTQRRLNINHNGTKKRAARICIQAARNSICVKAPQCRRAPEFTFRRLFPPGPFLFCALQSAPDEHASLS